MRSQVLVLVLAAGIAEATRAQSGGVFAGVPAAISVRTGTAGLDPGQILIKQNGFAQAPPAAWAGSGPTFNLRAILQGCGAPPGLDVDDFSLGEDWVLADDGTGEVHVPAGRWAAFTFSVTRASTGATGSRIAAEVAAAGHAGGAVFSYMLPGSVLPPHFVGAVERAHSAAELGLGATPGADVDGLDHVIPIYLLEPNLRALLPPFPTIYFTLPSSAVASVPASWWGGQPPSGATILRVVYSALAGWTCPSPWRSFRDLGLGQSEDITALAIDLLNQRILFSTRTPARDPLLFLYYGTDLVSPTPYKQPGGATPVSSSIGLGLNDDIDAVCSMDPSIRSRGAQFNPMYFFASMPVTPSLGPTAPMNGSAFRNFDPIHNVMVYDTWLVGWPPLTGRGPGYAAALLTFGNATTPVYSLAPLFVRNPNNAFAGDPQHYGLHVPLNFSMVGAGTLVTFRWYAVNSAFTELAEGWPVQVRL